MLPQRASLPARPHSPRQPCPQTRAQPHRRGRRHLVVRAGPGTEATRPRLQERKRNRSKNSAQKEHEPRGSAGRFLPVLRAAAGFEHRKFGVTSRHRTPPDAEAKRRRPVGKRALGSRAGGAGRHHGGGGRGELGVVAQ